MTIEQRLDLIEQRQEETLALLRQLAGSGGAIGQRDLAAEARAAVAKAQARRASRRDG